MHFYIYVKLDNNAIDIFEKDDNKFLQMMTNAMEDNRNFIIASRFKVDRYEGKNITFNGVIQNTSKEDLEKIEKAGFNVNDFNHHFCSFYSSLFFFGDKLYLSLFPDVRYHRSHRNSRIITNMPKLVNKILPMAIACSTHPVVLPRILAFKKNKKQTCDLNKCLSMKNIKYYYIMRDYNIKEKTLYQADTFSVYVNKYSSLNNDELYKLPEEIIHELKDDKQQITIDKIIEDGKEKYLIGYLHYPELFFQLIRGKVNAHFLKTVCEMEIKKTTTPMFFAKKELELKNHIVKAVAPFDSFEQAEEAIDQIFSKVFFIKFIDAN